PKERVHKKERVSIVFPCAFSRYTPETLCPQIKFDSRFNEAVVGMLATGGIELLVQPIEHWQQQHRNEHRSYQPLPSEQDLPPAFEAQINKHCQRRYHQPDRTLGQHRAADAQCDPEHSEKFSVA